MRFGLDVVSDDEEEVVEYPVSFNPVEPTRARALATLGKDVCNNHAGQIEQVTTPFDRLVMAYANGTLATQHGTPRVVETAAPQLNAMNATHYRAPRVVREAQPQPHTPEPMVESPRVKRNKRIVKCEERNTKRRKLNTEEIREKPSQEEPSPSHEEPSYDDGIKNDETEPEPEPREQESEPQTLDSLDSKQSKQIWKCTIHDELQHIETTEKEFRREFNELQKLFQALYDNPATDAPVHLPAPVRQLHDNLIEILSVGIATATNWAVENQTRTSLLHLHRRWIAMVKMKTLQIHVHTYILRGCIDNYPGQ
jgi:hypothetical protein